MPSPGLERTARLIAENVASAVERAHETILIRPLIREALVVKLLRELLSVMPTQSSAALADACNRCLNRIADLRLLAPWVDTVDPDDGSVTMHALS